MKLDLRALFLALIAHICILLLLFVAVDLSKLELGGIKKIETLETIISDAPILTTTERRQIQDVAHRRKMDAEKKQRLLEEKKKKIAEEKRKKEEAERKLKAEQKRKQALEQKRKEEATRKAAELKKKKDAEAKKKAEAEKKRLAEEAKKKKEQEKKRKEEAEKTRKAEEEARKKSAADAKRKAEEDARRKAQEALEAQMAEELAAEEAARARAAEEARLRDQLKPVLARWVAAMRNKVARNWLRPPGGSEYFECSVFVKQLNNGEVLDVRIDESCGSSVLDESVRKAVLKASPLPLPEDMRVFKKELIFVFKPD